MIICPFCDWENIEGADECDQCHQPLWDLSLPVPASTIEADLLRDRIDVLDPNLPATVAPDTPVGDVLQQMNRERIGCLLVMDGDQLAGIFSERDALLKLNSNVAKYADQPIAKFMTPDPITLQDTDKIAFALHKMDIGGYRHIPILSEEQLIGIISIRDILGYLTQRIAASRSE